MARPCDEIFKDILEEMESLDRALGEAFPTGELPVDGAAQALVLEAYINTRRTFGSVHALLWHRLLGDTDRTEEAAVLMRKMMNTLAIVIWVAEADDPNAYAARSELTDLYQQRTAIRDILDIERTPEREQKAAEQQGLIDAVEQHLRDIGADTTRRPSTTDIFRAVNPWWMIRWRYESDVAHGGVLGRATQRHGLEIGTPASPPRTANVAALTIGIMTAVVDRLLRLLALDKPDLDQFVKAQAERVRELLEQIEDCNQAGGHE